MRLDLRNAANSLQIEGKWGCYLGTHPIRGGAGGTSRAEDGIIYIYIYIYHGIFNGNGETLENLLLI